MSPLAPARPPRPANPILVVTNRNYAANPFAGYVTEMLKAEGLNEFQTVELASLSALQDPGAYLASFPAVVLAETSLTGAQQQLFRGYVAQGGALLAFRPDQGLADLFGLSYSGLRTEQNLEYFAVDPTGPGAGITAGSLQYHGAADNYTLTTGTALASLWTNATTASSVPAAVVAASGAGRAAAFTFDPAKSVVLTRQGNPAWKDTEGDGTGGYRPMDTFVRTTGEKWLDVSKIGIPQADELQRFVVNVLQSLIRQPMPRLWYLPGTNKTLMVNTGDSEGLSKAAMQPVISDINGYGGAFTSYLMTGSINDLSATDEAAWRAAGNEQGPHVDAANSCDALSPAYAAIAAALQEKYGHGAVTARNHRITWCGWSDMAAIEAANGTLLDTNYYHYGAFLASYGPAANGWFTGSGLPQRFADEAGNVLSIYQAATQWPDEWFADNGYSAAEAASIIEGMFQSAQSGYYSAFVANVHHVRYNNSRGDPTQAWAKLVWAYAQANNIPMWSAEHLATFTQARDASHFGNVRWASGSLTFDFSAPSAGQPITLMVPTSKGGSHLLTITIDGAPRTYTTDTVKGIEYALFTVTSASGHVVASYELDTTPPTLSDVRAESITDTGAAIRWTSGEAADSIVEYGLTPSYGSATTLAPALVFAHSVSLSGLSPHTTYHYRVVSRDDGGNPSTSEDFSFTTAAGTLTETTTADFADGTFTDTAPAAVGDGAVTLGSTIGATLFSDDFSGAAAGWTPLDGTWSVASGEYAYTIPTSYSASMITGLSSNDFSIESRQKVTVGGLAVLGYVWGIGSSPENGGWKNHSYMLQWDSNPRIRIFKWSSNPSGLQLIAEGTASSPGVGTWATLRLDVHGSSFEVFVNGTSVLQTSDSSYGAGGIGLVGYDSTNTHYDDVVVRSLGSSYVSPGTYTSSVLDAGTHADWLTLSSAGTTPAGTGISLGTRSGDTATPDTGWSQWATASSNIPSPDGRYLQYRATLTITTGTIAPILESVAASYAPSTDNRAPAFTQNLGNRSDLEGATISLNAGATDLDGDPLTYAANGLPAGLAIDTTSGLISGTIATGASSASPYSVTITVSDGIAPAVVDTFTWTVRGANQPPVVDPIGDQTNVEGAPVSLQVQATDPDGDHLTFSAEGLPSGLSIDSTTGLISGTIGYDANEHGPYAVTIAVSDGLIVGPVTVGFTWTLGDTNRPPTISAIGAQSTPASSTVSLQVQASDPDGDGLTYAATGLPSGLAINASTGLISGIVAWDASRGAPYPVQVTATDGPGAVATSSFNWTVTYLTWIETTPADFADGTFSGTAASAGSIVLGQNNFLDNFDGSAIDTSAWQVENWGGGTPAATVSGGWASVTNQNYLRSVAGYYQKTFSARATLTNGANGHIGLGTTVGAGLDGVPLDPHWAMFTVKNGAVLARTRLNDGQGLPGVGEVDTTITGVTIGDPHDWLIRWNADNSVEFWVDGALKATHTRSFSPSEPFHILMSGRPESDRRARTGSASTAYTPPPGPMRRRSSTAAARRSSRRSQPSRRRRRAPLSSSRPGPRLTAPPGPPGRLPARAAPSPPTPVATSSTGRR